MDWYDEMVSEIAAGTNVEAAELSLPDDVRSVLLDLARIASHDSGQRINAPFLCYALGYAVARGASLDDLATIVRRRERSG